MSETSLLLSADEITRFHEDGYLVIKDITTPDEIAHLKTIFERLFREQAGRERGAQYDLAGPDDDERPQLSPQIMNPVWFAPELRETHFRANAEAIARQLLGPDADEGFEHAVLKPARYGAPTTWHQDEAFQEDRAIEWDQISIWMPLQEVSAENGCMHFIPGSHRSGVLPHRSPNNDPRIHGLECFDGFDPAAERIVPLQLGSATVHHQRTLHYAGPNVSDVPRYAYVIVRKGPARQATERRAFPWILEKSTARQARAVAWEKRGGFLARALRRARAYVSRRGA